MTIQLEKLLSGDVRTIAKAITLVENEGVAFSDLMKEVYRHAGKGLILGITGSPGAGKSTLVDALAGYYSRNGLKVGIVAVDPTSPFTGGAILGDRIRMQTLGLDPKVFIRSMATRGNLGGISRATVDTAAILDAAGYEIVIIETVGVGQDEVEIVKAADLAVVVLVPGMGDDVQAIKAGIMEIGDIFVINKADRDGALRTEKELEAMLSLDEKTRDWDAPIIKTVAIEGKGVEELADAIESYRINVNVSADSRRKQVARWRILGILTERVLKEVLEKGDTSLRLESLAQEVAEKRVDPYSAVDQLLKPRT